MAFASRGPGDASLAVHQELSGPSAGAKPATQTPTYMHDVLPIFMSRCGRCHNEQQSLLLDWLNYGAAYKHRAQIDRRIWESWKGEYYKEPMPVPNSPESIGITPRERLVIRRWFKAGAPRGSSPPPRGAITKAQRINSGRQIFYSVCAACHQPSGLGLPHQFPPLAHSDYLNADKARATRTVLNGRQGPIVVNGETFNNSMPKFPLSDDEIADVLTFVYNAFGNDDGEVTPQDVDRARAQAPAAHQPAAPPPPSPFE